MLSRLYTTRTAILTAILVLLSTSVHSAGPDSAAEFSTLIKQLGVDSSTDRAARGKLRALLAKEKSMTNAVASGDVHEGIWSGVVERVYVDNLDAQGNLIPGPTQFYLNMGRKHLQVFFMDEAAGDATNGQHRVIRGYRSQRRVLVMESKKNQQEMLRSNKLRKNTKQRK